MSNISAACTQKEVDSVFEAAKKAQKVPTHCFPTSFCSRWTHQNALLGLGFDVPSLLQAWARTPLWKRAEYLHKVDGLMKDNAQPMADALLNEVCCNMPITCQIKIQGRLRAFQKL